ncbi:MAG: prephenate dehydratase [Deltaproteobacteria bacterium]
MRVGYLGPTGSYCEEALKIFVKEAGEVAPVEFATIYDALTAVTTGEINCAVVPIENSIEGSVNTTLDILAENESIKINAEIILKIRHNLLVKKGTKPEEVELILSHPQAIAQCGKYLRSNFPGVPTHAASSTSEGARETAASDLKWAAISNLKAASVYGLEILKEGIQDGDNNMTRFVVVSLEESEKTASDKTSMVFSTEDKPGSLYRILDIFNLWDINLTKIESRPAKNQLGKYIFFVDIEGHYSDSDIKEALTMVNRKTSYFRLLGSYRRIN